MVLCVCVSEWVLRESKLANQFGYIQSKCFELHDGERNGIVYWRRFMQRLWPQRAEEERSRRDETRRDDGSNSNLIACAPLCLLRISLICCCTISQRSPSIEAQSTVRRCARIQCFVEVARILVQNSRRTLIGYNSILPHCVLFFSFSLRRWRMHADRFEVWGLFLCQSWKADFQVWSVLCSLLCSLFSHKMHAFWTRTGNVNGTHAVRSLYAHWWASAWTEHTHTHSAARHTLHFLVSISSFWK